MIAETVQVVHFAWFGFGFVALIGGIILECIHLLVLLFIYKVSIWVWKDFRKCLIDGLSILLKVHYTYRSYLLV